MSKKERIIVIGGGLSGLVVAYQLMEKGHKVVVLEANTRLGGRIHTQEGVLATPLELGATWLSDSHPFLLHLIEVLGLSVYPQYSKGISLFKTKSFEPPQQFFVPASERPSYRIEGGTAQLIRALQQKIVGAEVHLNTAAAAIEVFPAYMRVTTTAETVFEADSVVVCLPPQLVGARLQFKPALPEALTGLLPHVQTWMLGSLKFVVEYDRPFWRAAGYSGMLYSHTGIISEMYDHTNKAEDKFGFTGFLSGGASAYAPEIRQELVLRQLSELFGPAAAQPMAYFDKIWTDEFVSAGAQVVHRPHQYNGHPLLRQAYYEGRLHFAGTETATEHGGYMEGAVRAAAAVVAHWK